MRKAFFLSLLIFLFSAPRACFAATPTSDQVEEIKEKIASQVAEINNDAVRFITFGKVEKIDSQNKTFTLAASQKKYSVSYLQKTIFYWVRNDDTKLSLNFTNLEVDDEIVVIGNLSMVNNQINADYIYGKSYLKLITAKISKVDAAAKTLQVKTLSAETEFNVDIGNIQNDLKSVDRHIEKEAAIGDLATGQIVVVKGLLKDPEKNNLTAKSLYLIQN